MTLGSPLHADTAIRRMGGASQQLFIETPVGPARAWTNQPQNMAKETTR